MSSIVEKHLLVKPCEKRRKKKKRIVAVIQRKNETGKYLCRVANERRGMFACIDIWRMCIRAFQI